MIGARLEPCQSLLGAHSSAKSPPPHHYNTALTSLFLHHFSILSSSFPHLFSLGLPPRLPGKLGGPENRMPSHPMTPRPPKLAWWPSCASHEAGIIGQSLHLNLQGVKDKILTWSSNFSFGLGIILSNLTGADPMPRPATGLPCA